MSSPSLSSLSNDDVTLFCAKAKTAQKSAVFQSLATKNPSLEDLAILLSDAATDSLELLTQRSSELTRQYFGRCIALFTPLYISNYCMNQCLYCSFSSHNTINRKQLSEEQIHAECETLARTGIRHVLVVTGEDPSYTDFVYIKKSLLIISRYFSSVSIEIYPLKQELYHDLFMHAHVDAVTIYQETYNRELYKKLHGRGPKSDYEYRLQAPDRICKAHARNLTVGVLLGLDDFRVEVLRLAMHVLSLQKQYPETEISVAFPRLCPIVGNFTAEHPVNDRHYVQIIAAFRIAFPQVGITLSTRESPKMRDGLVRIGITKMSANVSTAVGSHSHAPSTTQFTISDTRTVAEVCDSLLLLGYQPVLHTWNKKMDTDIQAGGLP